MCDTRQCCLRHPRACHGTSSNRVPHRDDDAPAISRALRRMASAEGDLAVSHTTGANMPFAHNWWQHLQRAGVRNFALLATDDSAAVELARRLPDHFVRCPRSIVTPATTGPVGYRSAGWTRLMFAVPQMVRWVLRQGINVLWMDTDVVALANPFPIIRAQLHLAALSDDGAELSGDDAAPGSVPGSWSPTDRTASRGSSQRRALGAPAAPGAPALLASVDGRVPDEDLHECRVAYTGDGRWGRSAGGWKLCGGLFYVQPGAAALAFLRDWERRLRAPGAGAKNQPHYNEALRAHQQALRVVVLPCDLFPNGFRFASAAWRTAQRRSPVLVHANWLKGSRAKHERLRQWGLWRGDERPPQNSTEIAMTSR